MISPSAETPSRLRRRPIAMLPRHDIFHLPSTMICVDAYLVVYLFVMFPTGILIYFHVRSTVSPMQTALPFYGGHP